MSGFVSHCTKKIDKKGRVSVPASFRQVLTRDGFEGVHCYPSLDMAAIDCGGNALLGEIEKQLGRFVPFSEDHDFLASAFYGSSEHLGFDPEGRISLTESLLSAAGIADEVTFVGLGYKFQIWEPQRWLAHREEATRRLAALRRSLGSRTEPPKGEGA
ncbi:division/cell wall cluster transcriptional repressor MraZ [Methylobrevis albus]|uniref:Transcriptional regulator MraZ n=1 Tax=Methylobrevis albus TaxID=2793297 RepID=A0A931HZ04_9HYPH|nr:division/cell wall cluster transcriptional repressor MraZ [Methylobrevis albus]MBH0236682.1 division/cell wall cluster transcriptional repressor MraZ [Methylobrevis albus]